LNAEKDFEIGQILWLREQKYENIGFRSHFGFCSHFVELQNFWLIFLGATLDKSTDLRFLEARFVMLSS
jgi:hypothetical protein